MSERRVVVVTNGRVLHNHALAPLDLLIDGGRIAALGGPGAFAGAADAEIFDARGLLVLPGAIDSHIHARAPSHPEREDFGSATRAAAAGGVTAVIEMPISVPPATDGAVVTERARLAARDAQVDVGFYASCATLDPADLDSSIEAGALAFKAFLQAVPAGREAEFTGLCLPSNREVFRAFELLAAHGRGLPCAFHAEDEGMLRRLEEGLRAAGRRDGLAHAASRPTVVEAASVALLLQLAGYFGVHLQVPHVSSRATVELIREAKARGVPVTAETCPQYLQFDASALERLGPFAKCNPPFKSADDVEAIWEGLRDGTLDTIASDHSPFTTEEKERAREDIWLAPPGFPGVEVLAPFAIGAMLEDRLSLRRLSEVLYENPAKIFGLWPRKGALQPGADADLVLYDPAPRGVFRHEEFLTRSAGAGLIWNGVPRVGRVVTTLLRGQPVFRDGAPVDGPTRGEVLRRAAA